MRKTTKEFILRAIVAASVYICGVFIIGTFDEFLTKISRETLILIILFGFAKLGLFIGNKLVDEEEDK